MLTRALMTLLFAHGIIAGAALAQTIQTTEYSRASGGEIEAVTKQTDRLSGSLGISLSRSGLPFLRQYDATLGGTVLKDRIWFFATAQTGSRMWDRGTAMQSGKMNLRLSEAQSLTASASRATNTTTMTIPSSFLSLRYTGILSSNSFFTASVSQRSTKQPSLMLLGQ